MLFLVSQQTMLSLLTLLVCVTCNLRILYSFKSIDSQHVEPKSLLTIYIILTGILDTSHNFCLWSMGLMNGLVPLTVTLVRMITFTLLTSLFTKTTR